MSRLIVRRRPDGLIQLCRRSPWHLLADRALLVLLALCATSACVMVAIALIGIEFPFALALTLPLVALGLWAGRSAREGELATAPVRDPPPRRAA